MNGNDAGAIDAAGVLPAGAVLTRVVTGATWSEGPVWMPERGVLRWSDIPANRILEVDPEDGELVVHRTDVEFTNGRTLDLDGAVIQCSHGRRAIEREVDGVTTTLVERFDGVRLNSPNDVVVASDGTIWFTDPPYGIVQDHEGRLADPEYDGNYVFRFDPDSGVLAAMVTDMDEPNGLAFSPDESILYVADSGAVLRGGDGPHEIVAYDVAADGTCFGRRVFAVIEPGVPDGLRVDVEGRIWSSSSGAVQVFTPEAERIAVIPVPEGVGNLCFGGHDGTTLFIAAATSIYSIPTLTRQAARPARSVMA